MITIEPRFKLIYDHPFTLAFGGVEISLEGPYNIKKLTREISDVIKDIGNYLKRSYEIKTMVEIPKENLLLTRMKPINAELDKKSLDLDIRVIKTHEAAKYINNVCKRLVIENKESAIVTKEGGFHIFHILKKEFNPKSTKFLLETIENLLFGLFNQKYNVIKSEINPYYLEHDVEVKKPSRELYY